MWNLVSEMLWDKMCMRQNVRFAKSLGGKISIDEAPWGKLPRSTDKKWDLYG
jgi:hypothetical protein